MIFSRKGRGRRDERARTHWTAEISSGWRDPSAREPEPLETPEFGPYDIAVAPDDGVPRIDLGSLLVPNLPDAPVQVEAAPNGQIIRVQLEHQGSRLQLAAYAAPRTEGIWDEVREEIRTALASSGAKVVEVDSDYGPALAARQGGTGGQPVVETRHLGIDGPRWFVHAVFIGPAATDPSQAPPLWTALRGLVVNRGKEARPVKELLPLRLPAEIAARIAEMAARQAAAAKAAQAQAQAQAVQAAQQRAAQAAAVRTAQTAQPGVSRVAQPASAGTATAQAESARNEPAENEPAENEPELAEPELAEPESVEAKSTTAGASTGPGDEARVDGPAVGAPSGATASGAAPSAAASGEISQAAPANGKRTAPASPSPGRKPAGRSGSRNRRAR